MVMEGRTKIRIIHVSRMVRYGGRMEKSDMVLSLLQSSLARAVSFADMDVSCSMECGLLNEGEGSSVGNSFGRKANANDAC